MSPTILIIGGVAGGAAAATRIRRLNENAQIIMIERSEHISYANCGLPYYIGDVIKQKDSLLVQSPEKMKAWYNIDVRVCQEALQIDPQKKIVLIRNLQTQEVYEENFDALVLSPGAKPVNISQLGPESCVFTLRTVQDAQMIREAAENVGKRVVVVGGGFIGIEVAENLHERGIVVTLLEKFDILMPFDREMSNYLKLHMMKKGIRIKTGLGVDHIERREGENVVFLDNGDSLPTDMVIMSIGTRPDTAIAQKAGLLLDGGGRILVDNHMRTSNPDIYAVGDAVQVLHYVSGQHVPVALAGPAAKQARVAADNIFGKNVSYNGVLSSTVIKVLDLTGAATGLNEKQLKSLGLKYEKCYTHTNNHAAYYPGANPVSLKVLFNPESGELYGAQAVGTTGTEKRIDVISTAIKAGLSVTELQSLDLCYAPPFGSAKDPVNMAGYVAENMINGMYPYFHYEELKSIDLSKNTLLDVRTKREHNWETIPNSINIPLEELRERLYKLPLEKPIYLYCRTGAKSYAAARILQQNGYRVKNLIGGYRTIQAAFPLAEGIYDPFWD